MRGQDNRLIVPTQYPIEIDSRMMGITLLALDGLPNLQGAEVLAFLQKEDGSSGLIVDLESGGMVDPEMNAISVPDPSAILSPIATGNACAPARTASPATSS